VLALLLACVTLGVVQTADTLGRGNAEASAQTGIVTVHAPGAGAGADTVVPLVVSDTYLRYGLTDRVDVSGSFGLNGLGAGVKVQLTEPGNGIFYASLAPSAQVFPLLGVFTHVDLPLLFGVPFGPHQLVASGRAHVYDYRGELFGNGTLVTAGAAVGFALDFGNGVWVQPEYSVHFPIEGSVVFTSPSLAPGTEATLSQFVLSASYRFDGEDFR
jgi:hypothetical protein